MVYTKDSVWCLLFTLKPILPLENKAQEIACTVTSRCASCMQRGFRMDELHACKSIKTPLGSPPMLFKIVSYFCV